MDHFTYRAVPGGGDALACEETPLEEIATQVGTPVYVYSTATLERHYRVFRDAFLRTPPRIDFAVKASPNVSVIATLARLGAGADTVSEGEIRRALAAGVPPERIVFSGVGKADGELAFALKTGIGEINVESPPELDRLAAIAASLALPARIALRVNPEVGAGGHDKISTGRSGDKFGVSLAEARRLYALAAADPFLEPVGLACHIGSQISDLAPLKSAFETMRGLVTTLRADGMSVSRLDLGGGLGVPYFNAPAPPSPRDFAAMAEEVTDGLDVELAFEPGRVIVANAGVLLSRVLHVHVRPEGRRFLVLDAAMNDLMRPAMYGAFHDIRPVVRPAPDAVPSPFDVVGPVCESSDTFAKDRMLPPIGAGELVALMTAGAYGASMSNEYNSRLLVPEVLVSGARFAVIRPRPTYADMLAREATAPWLAAPALARTPSPADA